MTRPEAMRLCREMYGRWTGPEVRDYLAEHGVEVSMRTIGRWAEDGNVEQVREETERARQRRVAARTFKRIEALRARRLSHADIAAVLSVDHGIEVGIDQIRYALKVGYTPKNLVEALIR